MAYNKPQIPSPQTIRDPVLRSILVSLRDRVESLSIALAEADKKIAVLQQKTN